MVAESKKLDIPFIWANKPNQYDFALTKARENDVLYYACRGKDKREKYLVLCYDTDLEPVMWLVFNDPACRNRFLIVLDRFLEAQQ